jgi:hypothetical protein
MPWGTNPALPTDIEAELTTGLTAALTDVPVSSSLEGHTPGSERVLVNLVVAPSIEGYRRRQRVHFQTFAGDADAAYALMADVLESLGDLVGTGRITALKVANGPVPVPSAYLNSDDPARYFLAVDFTTVDL